ncbi:unnamed protein product [Eruca vesicaria subsp. sativa]|uniref:N-acetyltransferase domain-containing protein n=1 Tax=Eruca vesicaria subsp. sativa TaxID=29727 RepID=A0ABC8K665_ERUVS|nr:unnamed protein product [Eruca vesicaria subsp. sativa]
MGFVVCVGNASLASMELRWVRRRSKCDVDAPRSIPVFISTLKRDINLEELRHLYSRCDHSCNRLSKDGGSSIVDMKKLRTAISRSDVVVSVFCKSHHVEKSTSDKDDDDDAEEERLSSSSLFPLDLRRQSKEESSLGHMFQDVLPLSPSSGQLVGFGRAYSDYGLTASIHDLMVLPSLQRMGIGKLIVNRITRLLTSRDIYDIAALCFEHERPFFKACGFADDRMGSTTMMFTKSLEA